MSFVTCFSGCGSASSGSTASEENTQTLDMSIGIVKSIDTEKNQIALDVMEKSKREGEPPTDEDGNTTSKPDGEPPEMKEKTYILSSSIYIQDENGNQITLEDVKEGDFIQFTVEDGEIATISLKKMDKDRKSKTARPNQL